MPYFRVTWEMYFETDTPQEAAEEALRVQRDPASEATCFVVVNMGTGDQMYVDIDIVDP